VSPSSSSAIPGYAPNSLPAEYAFLQLLATQTSIPQPIAHALDTTLTLLPYPYLLLALPRGQTLSSLRVSGKLSPRQTLLLDLRAGAYLKQLHEIQNDWFGLPAQEAEGLYSWQEAFTSLLEALLEEAQERQVQIPYHDVRQYLSRAIGSFLFDDCEVPSLISFAGDEDDILVYLDDANGEEDEPLITSFLSFSHALWGDPLMETTFLDPSGALVEGYGGSPIVFARQKTKRMWYTVFLALMVLVQAQRDEETIVAAPIQESKVEWAKRTLDQCIRDLKDAPTY